MPTRPVTDEFLYTVSSDGLAGWIRKDMHEDLLADLLDDPDGFLNDPSSQILKNEAKIKVVRRTLTARRGATQAVVIKRFYYPSLLRRIGFLFRSSPAVRCLRGALVLKGQGIPTAQPIAALEHRSWGSRGTSYFVTEELTGSQASPAFWHDVLPTLSSDKCVGRRRALLREIATLFHKLHSRGIYHQDLKGNNILIRSDGDRWQCSLVDVDGVWRRHPLGWSKRVKNLVQLYRTLGRQANIRDKVYFLKHYADLSSLSRDDRKDLARRVLAVSRKSELRSLRKQAKRGGLSPSSF